ncbi:hypothetical protein O3P69_017966 [Scylla paramamosain]|uniref:Uncharacterized protein n=1 Tax=Scylla paramamosain TaxID=85552 RepID=A0AAW0THY4_SCYPA
MPRQVKANRGKGREKQCLRPPWLQLGYTAVLGGWAKVFLPLSLTFPSTLSNTHLDSLQEILPPAVTRRGSNVRSKKKNVAAAQPIKPAGGGSASSTCSAEVQCGL